MSLKVRDIFFANYEELKLRLHECHDEKYVLFTVAP